MEKEGCPDGSEGPLAPHARAGVPRAATHARLSPAQIAQPGEQKSLGWGVVSVSHQALTLAAGMQPSSGILEAT